MTARSTIRGRAPRRLRLRDLAVLVMAGCSDSTAPDSITVPAFAFVSDAEGVPAIFRYETGTITRLSQAGHDDREPHSAAGRIVFTSRRDGNDEIYIADLALANPQRLTNASSNDTRAALSPSGSTVAFVSSRSGAPRVWLMDADGANPRVLDTGSPTFVPEGSPSWSPGGDRIAFTSTRTNTSQVFVMAAAGGSATQLSRESGGAFGTAWSAEGTVIHYMALAGGPKIMRVPAAGGTATIFAEDEAGLSEVACAAGACLVTAGPLDAAGDIIALRSDGRSRRTLLARPANDHQATILVPQ